MFELNKHPIGLDDLADVRYLHASAFRMTGAAYHAPAEIEAYSKRINSTDYIQECLNCSLHGLWHNHMLIGTAGWCPSNDNRNTARIRKVFVHNFYIGLGLGRMLVDETETRALNAGFTSLSVRASASSIPFFKSLGYKTNSHGALALGSNQDIAVTYMRKEAVKAKHNSAPPSPHSRQTPSSVILPG